MDIKKDFTDLEISKLAGVARDKVLVEALRKVMLTGLYSNGTLRKGVDSEPTRNAALSLVANQASSMLSDAEVGADLRALWSGLQALETGLNKLKDFEEIEPSEESENNEAI